MGCRPLSLRLMTPTFGRSQCPEGARRDGGIPAARNTESRNDRRDVMLRGLGRNAQARGDFNVAQPFIDQTQDLRLPPR